MLEADDEVGGLAGSFEAGGRRLEKFYHHWFTSDRYVMQLLSDLGLKDQIVTRPTRTGMYVANRFFKLSSPLDLLRFQPLPVSSIEFAWGFSRSERAVCGIGELSSTARPPIG